MLKERLIQTFGDNELKLAEKWSSRPTGTAVYQDRNQRRATVKSVFAKGEMCGWPRDVDHFLASHAKSPDKSSLVYVIPRVAKWPVFHRPGRHFTADLAEAAILKISA